MKPDTEVADRLAPSVPVSLIRATTLWFVLAVFAAEFALILWLNHGRFIYTLDDAYIHLSLTENIVRGHYGVNLQEYSAPSSSILWPFLLAPFAWFSLEEYAPLAINMGTTVATLLLFRHALAQSLRLDVHPQLIIKAELLVLFLVFALNLVGMVFMGMEHSLQVLLAVAVVVGLAQVGVRGAVPAWLLIAIALGPLVRYENLALSVPALAYLGWAGRRREAAVAASALLLALAAFSAFLASLGLDWLPTSVAAKSSAINTGSLDALIANFKDNWRDSGAQPLWLAMTLLVAGVFYSRRYRGLAVVLVAAIALHMILGRFGWYERYQMYILAPALLGLVYVFGDVAARVLQRQTVFVVAAVLAVAGVSVFGRYLYVQVTTPLAANNIYEQQYQMSRFVREFYRRPVGINDLGWVAYQNDQYVLDLWGLASPQALALRSRHGDDGRWMQLLADRHDVRLAIVYEHWFKDIPANWVPLATMYLGKKRITAASRAVTFYALNPATAAEVRPLLARFGETLPAGVRLVADPTPVLRCTPEHIPDPKM